MTDLYETLGVARDASPEQIRVAYRRLAQDHHPDKHGGDAGRFRAVQAAWEVLRDSERRAAYDRDGFSSDPNQIRQKAEALVADGLAAAMLVDTGAFFVDYMDPVGEVAQELASGLKNSKKGEEDARAKRKVVERALGRIKRKEGHNLAATLLQGKLDEIDAFVSRNLEHQAVLVEAQKVVKEYSWEGATPAEKPAPETRYWINS